MILRDIPSDSSDPASPGASSGQTPIDTIVVTAKRDYTYWIIGGLALALFLLPRSVPK